MFYFSDKLSNVPRIKKLKKRNTVLCTPGSESMAAAFSKND